VLDAFLGGLVRPLINENPLYPKSTAIDHFGMGGQNLNLGFAMDIINSDDFSWAATLDYHNALEAVLYPATARYPLLNFSAGSELTFFNTVTVRVGVSDMYPCYGAGLNLEKWRLDFAVYGKEITTQASTKTVICAGASFLLRFQTEG
jgi:hypothetical protein